MAAAVQASASRTSEELFKVVQHHYNPFRDVVTRNEFIPERQLKVDAIASLRCGLTMRIRPAL